jgi:hypothetical protein
MKLDIRKERVLHNNGDYRIRYIASGRDALSDRYELCIGDTEEEAINRWKEAITAARAEKTLEKYTVEVEVK